jgi:prepilin-type N-terminal cleavage/methylation domain-containing protein
MTVRYYRRLRHRGFTLVEMMVVVFIIVVLMSILLPVVSGVRKRGFDVRTRSLMQKIASACQVYFSDWHAYPGLLPEAQLYPNSNNLINGIKITSTENLTLSLLGGVNPASAAYTFSSSGPVSFNPANPKQYHAYIDYVPAEMDWAPTMGGDGTYVAQYNFKNPPTKDTIIPEFIDGYSEPKPILYLRARRSAPAVIDGDDNSDTLAGTKPAQYSRFDVLIYTGQDTAATPTDKGLANDALKFTNSQPPQPQYYQSWYDAFRNEGISPIDTAGHAPPNITEVAKGKDGFLLIGAGPSRIWLGRDAIFLSN